METRPFNMRDFAASLPMVAVAAAFAVVVMLTGCNSAAGSVTPSPTTGVNVEPTQTQGTQGTYPKFGHAPDYSWVAGQVAFTKIQGGCTYIRSAPPEAASPSSEQPTPSGPIVGTAERSDVSPPLRDITPLPPSAQQQEPVGDSFVPGGPGWDTSQVKHGDYVVVFGHIAGPDEPKEMCPGGQGYVVERMILNP